MSDLIKREDAIATIGVMYERCDTHDIIDYRDLMLEAVNVLPSADRPQGEWIGEADGYADGEFVYDTWYCSNCDYAVDDDEPPTWNFCPNCGARMKGANDE